ncbi:non-ribosomal peptide synthetase [Streptomyces sp. E5N91]|uniref:non-ribosomal peptide synthetase n=1 Tax=Streptomyces sp. E5N91 TaxID=1851996 RepID=UPI000EF58BB4|nr:non-ribosomal peptide synthetase [Streptomyces sp. E5N91]
MTDLARIPLSAAQRGVWFAHLLDPSQQTFNCAEYLAVDGALDIGLLRSAWARLRAEADVVRVRSIDSADGLWQLVEPPDDTELPLIDCSGSRDPEAAAHDWMQADLTRPVDLSRPPVSAFALLELAPDRYYFYYRMHHALVDGYSIRMIGKRLATLYSALADGRPDPGPKFAPLTVLIDEDREYRASAQFQRDREYWTERFADRPGATRLPGWPRASEGDGPRRLNAPGALPASEVDGLHAIAVAAGVTWQIVLVAAIAAYTRRVTGQREVILGLPVAGRRSGASRRTPGMATNSIALRLRVDASRSLADLVAHVAEEVRGALRHERYRAEDLRRDLELEESGRPFIGPMINFMPGDPTLRFGEHPATAHNLASGPIVDLSVSVAESGDATGLTLVFEANPDSHDERGFLDHRDRLMAFLKKAAAAPDRPLSRVGILLPEERQHLLTERNRTTRYVPPQTVPQLFARQAARTPDAPAVRHDGSSWTYAELDAWSNALATDLRAQGLGPEEFAAIRLGRSPELIVAMLAVLKSGAAYVPVDPDYPAERIEYMLSDLAPGCVISAVAPPPDEPVEAPVAAATVDPAHPAYLIYTSGSTGRPKAVAVPHAAMRNFVLDHARRFGLNETSRALQFVSPSFDVATGDIWPTLLTGGCLVLAPEARTMGAETLLTLLAAERITHATIPPAMLAQLPHPELPDLAVLITGGERVDPEVVRRWGAGRRMVNVYGVTEAAVATTTSTLVPGTQAAIGRPIDNSQVYVLDSGLQPLPAGAPGQLFIAGIGLARGYVRRPGPTAERFLPCPYGPPGSRMYATGDLVQWRRDGELEFLGRIDDQVKVRGFRIEPGEIEAALMANPGVRTAVVIVREDQPGRPRLIAFVQPFPDHGTTPIQLRRFLGQSLPEYMVPSAVVLLEEIPLTPNGKVDRRALTMPVRTAEKADEPSAGSLESALCALFAEVLGVERVGVHDSFFDLGGDSIAVVPLVSRARAENIEFSARDVFRHPTIGRLASVAARIAPTEVTELTSAVVDLTAEQRAALRTTHPSMTEVLPVSPLQEGFLFHSLLTGPSSDAYASQLTFDLEGPLDTRALRAAGEQLLVRHSNLRVAFAHAELPEPVQVVYADVALPWDQVDLAALPDEEKASEARRLAAVDRDKGFDLAAPPLLRFLLLRLSPTSYRLVLTAHHILWDGWSTSTLVQELFTLYSGGSLPPVVPYRGYLDWLAAQDRDASRRAWSSALEGLAAPTIVAPGAPPADRHHQVRCDLSPALAESVNAYARTHGVTVNTLVQVAWATVLGQATGLDDVVFGCSVSGRAPELPGSQHMVGLLTNTIPVRVRRRPDEPLSALVGRLQADQVELMPHHYLGLGDILRCADLGPDLFDSAIMFVNYSFDPTRWAAPLTDLKLTAFEVEDDTHYPLRLAVVPGPPFHLRLGYHPELFRRRDADRMLSRLISAFESIVADGPGRPTDRP